MPATFCKQERLSSFKEIQALMKGGKTFFHYPFKVVYMDVAHEQTNGTQHLNAIMVSVPKRHFKRAVKRNLLKRRIRESYRLNKGMLVAPQGCKTNVLFIYVAKEVLEFSYIERKLKDILEKISSGTVKEETPKAGNIDATESQTNS